MAKGAPGSITVWVVLVVAALLVGAGQLILWPASRPGSRRPPATVVMPAPPADSAAAEQEAHRALRPAPAAQEEAPHAEQASLPRAQYDARAAPAADSSREPYTDDEPLNAQDDINDDPSQALEPSFVPPPPDPRPDRWRPDEGIHPATFCNVKNPPAPDGTRTAPMSIFTPYDVTQSTDIDCHFAPLKYSKLIPRYNVCTSDPEEDSVVSAALHRTGRWMGVFEIEIIRNVAACTPERPFFVDLGVGLGQAALLAATAGCTVIGFEPIAENLHRAYRTAEANGVQDRMYFFLNAILAEPKEQTYMAYIKGNPAASRTVERDPSNKRWVHGVTLDDFFAWEGRPKHPTEARLVEPRDVNMIMVFTEGHDPDSLFSAQVALQAGHPPYIHIPVHPRNSDACAVTHSFHFMYSAGYKCFLDGGSQWTFAQWHNYLSNPHNGQLLPYFVHEAVAEQSRQKFDDWYADEKQ